MRMERKDAYEDGVAAGREEGLTAGREEGLAAGRDAGREEERTQLFELISKLSSDGLSELIPKLASDPDFYHEMMRKYFG